MRLFLRRETNTGGGELAHRSRSQSAGGSILEHALQNSRLSVKRATLQRTNHYKEVSWLAVGGLSVIVVSFCLTVVIRLATWGECEKEGYHGCVVRAYPVLDNEIYQSTYRACACSTFIYVDDTRCLTKSNESANTTTGTVKLSSTTTPFASEVLNSSAILNPTVSLFIATCEEDGRLLDTIAAHAKQLSVLTLAKVDSVKDRADDSYSWEVPASFGRVAGTADAWLPLQVIHIMYLKVRGTIPSSIGMLSSLRVLIFEETSKLLSGTFPAFLTEMNLVALYLNGNRLSGTIPMLLGQLTCTYG